MNLKELSDDELISLYKKLDDEANLNLTYSNTAKITNNSAYRVAW